MKVALISKSDIRPSDDPWSWLKSVCIGSHEVVFKGNVVAWLTEISPLLMKYQYESFELEDKDMVLILEIYKIFRMIPPQLPYKPSFRVSKKESEKKEVEKENKNVNNLFEQYIKQTPDISLSHLNNHTDYNKHNDCNGQNDHLDHSRDIHGDYGRDYDDHMDSSKFIHGDWIGWNNQHDDGYQDYDDQSHLDETHSDSYNEYEDHLHYDNFYTDYNEHTDINK